MTLIKDIDIASLLIADPVGVDLPIQQLQIELGLEIPWLEKSFHRAYREEDVELKQFKPEVYIGTNEYIEVFPNDEVSGMSFFDVKSDITPLDSVLFEVDVTIIFALNLDLAFPLLTHRATEEAKGDAVRVIQDFASGWQAQEINIFEGVQNVYSRYNWKLPEAFIDKQPYFVFAIETKVRFDYVLDCNCG